MTKPIINYGDTIQAARSEPHPTKRGEYVAEMHPAKAIGFSNYAASRRDWGWRGDVLVEFADGHKTWNPLS